MMNFQFRMLNSRKGELIVCEDTSDEGDASYLGMTISVQKQTLNLFEAIPQMQAEFNHVLMRLCACRALDYRERERFK